MKIFYLIFFLLGILLSRSSAQIDQAMNAGIKLKEMRYFLSSNEAVLPDHEKLDKETKQSWGWKTSRGYFPPDPRNVQQTMRTCEAKFGINAGSEPNNSPHYILKDLQSIEDTMAHSLHCSFIYRFASTTEPLEEISDTGIIYKIHYRVICKRDANTEHGISEATVVYGNENENDLEHPELLQKISWKDYHDSINTSFYVKQKTEPEDITTFPLLRKYPALAGAISHTYALINKDIQVDDYLLPLNLNKAVFEKYHFWKIDCWVERKFPENIWIRGLRTQTNVAK